MDDCVTLRPSQAMYQNTSQKKLHEDAKSNLGRNVKRLRQSLKLSQEELGLRIDADQAYISRIEAGRLNPTLESIAELANALETKVRNLFD